MKYTQRSQRVNQEIDHHLQLISQTIRAHTSDLVSVVLMGGFAKGEGSVKIKSGQVTPLNDYDVYLITRNSKTESEINQLNKFCNQAIGKKGQPFHDFDIFYDFDKSFFVDLHHLTLKQLGKLYPMIRTYDLRNFGQVLWGQNVLPQIPNYSLKEVSSPPEALRLLFNRMTNFIQFFRPQFLNLKQKNSFESLTYYTCRAVISVAWVLLIYKQKTKLTNREILIATKKNLSLDYPKFAKQFPLFVKDLEMATRWKLKPDSLEIDTIKLWFRTRDYLGFTAKHLLQDALQLKIKNWTHLSFVIQYKLTSIYYHPYLKHQIKLMTHLESDFLSSIFLWARKYLNLLFFWRVKKHTGRFWFSILTLHPAPDLQIFSTLPLIVFSLNPNGKVNLKMLRLAQKKLKKIYPISTRIPRKPEEFWQQMAENYGTIYILFFWQKLV